jgi:hypothetical protein
MTITPPDATVWWDVDEVTAAALAVLRLEAGDVDAARVRALVPTAGEQIAQYVDAVAVPVVIPATWDQAIVDVTVALYRAKDTPPASPDLAFAGGYTPPVDALSTVRSALRPYRQRWGMA